MARPRTEVGSFGAVRLIGQVQVDGRWTTVPEGTRPTRWRARTKYRDEDGMLRDVERFAPTKAKAEAALKRAVKERQAPAGKTDMRADMTLVDAGGVWLERRVKREDGGLSQSTRDQYAANFARYVQGSTIQGLTLREVNRVAALERYLQGIADSHGTGAAKTARSVVSGILTEAVRLRVLPFNACREVRPAKASERKATDRDTTRALTREERERFLQVLREDDRAEVVDVIDLGHFIAGTGVRISEALQQRWEDIDLDAGTVRVRGTKTEASDRTLHLPAWLLDRLTARDENADTFGLVFPSPRLTDQKVRDRRNIARELRRVLDAAGLEWATPHTFRRTVASDIDAAGLSIALAANVLGHADPAMTARVYLGRKGSTEAAAAVL
ncbi:tyrosine-type recombinase/integrase [Aeromicrobium sp. CF4.19]|uniref:tyrosine-type recombinase/integrase n=1 Tax=Aeromicrobium sp. CF4.19 TaxID=3373082 RepID=UPI003EE6676A